MSALIGSWSFETAVRTLWQEARGEILIGQRAVAHVLWNRLHSGKFGSTLAEVCLEPFQFSGWNAHDPNRREVARLADDDAVLSALRKVLADCEAAPDITNGATFYHSQAMAHLPGWTIGMTRVGVFGTQIFYRQNLNAVVR